MAPNQVGFVGPGLHAGLAPRAALPDRLGPRGRRSEVTAGLGALQAGGFKPVPALQEVLKPSPVPTVGALFHALSFTGGAAAIRLLVRRAKHQKRSRLARAQSGVATVKPQAQPGSAASMLDPEDAWIAKVDQEAFAKEVHQLGRELLAEEKTGGQAHLEHLHKLVSWSDALAIIGIGTMWLAPNPLTVLALGFWTHSRFTMVGHHTMHGGHDRIDPTGRYHRSRFGSHNLLRRMIDWFDWMLPEAWGYEHDQHHFRLSEDMDPDVVPNVSRTWEGMPKKYVMTFLTFLIWKWGYVAPQTYKELKAKEFQKKRKPFPDGFDRTRPMTFLEAFRKEGGNVFSVWNFMAEVFLPYLLIHFVLLPLPLAFIDPALFWNAEWNLVLGDMLANFLLFACVATNHCGSDMYRFRRPCRPFSPTFYVRAVCATTNFQFGGDVVNFLHGWTNMQIEHHCWPHLSMLSLSRGQPRLKEICERHGVPYVAESVLTRLQKTVAVMLEQAEMRWYPEQWEREADLMAMNKGRS